MSKPDPNAFPVPAKPGAGNSLPPEGGAEAYARWLEHMQRSRGRHAAITRNLYTWSNYKSWADKMRTALEAEQAK